MQTLPTNQNNYLVVHQRLESHTSRSGYTWQVLDNSAGNYQYMHSISQLASLLVFVKEYQKEQCPIRTMNSSWRVLSHRVNSSTRFLRRSLGSKDWMTFLMAQLGFPLSWYHHCSGRVTSWEASCGKSLVNNEVGRPTSPAVTTNSAISRWTSILRPADGGALLLLLAPELSRAGHALRNVWMARVRGDTTHSGLPCFASMVANFPCRPDACCCPFGVRDGSKIMGSPNPLLSMTALLYSDSPCRTMTRNFRCFSGLKMGK
mmetsp:Transcript_28813/g.63474  ORF Transcript_28813/g.63474 Transcript_28813/m.63474 type:complete len:261 (+) Transcript_28813:1445-2227(+)